MAGGGAGGGSLVRSSPLREPAIHGRGAMLRLFGALDLVALAVRRDEIRGLVFSPIGEGDDVIEREVVQRDRGVAESAEPAAVVVAEPF